jgi:hypothetical protein
MRSRFVLALIASTLLTACDGLKEALTAHVDVAARAGSQQLSVTRLGDLLGGSKLGIPVTKQNAQTIAQLWTGYQQVAYAGAHGDSLNDHKLIDEATAPLQNNLRLQRFMAEVQKTFKVDSGSEASYNQAAGGVLGARHILFSFPAAATQAQKDSVLKRAQAVRATLTAANFAGNVKKYSGDPGAAQNNGLYVFRPHDMVPEFENATKALKPGEISQPVQSQFGYHVIERLPYAEVKDQYAQLYAGNSGAAAESTYFAQLDAGAKIEVKDNAPTTVKGALADPSAHHNDRGVLASYKGGDLTVAQFFNWLETFPPQQQQNVMRGLGTQPDSVVKGFVRQIAERNILLMRADSAKIEVPADQKTNLYVEFSQLVGNMMQALGVDSKALADSAKNTAEKERLAAARADAYLDHVLAGEAQPIQVPPPLKKMLDAKYEASVNQTGVDRAFERAQKVRAAADSAKAANQPKSQVPIPGVGAPPPAQPTPPQPAPKKP